jgi:hypothetical protein
LKRPDPSFPNLISYQIALFTKLKILLSITILILLPIFSHAWATTDLSKIGSPVVSIYPTSGPPGTKITITVTNIPDISKESYPYADLYLYLPFSRSFGTTVQSQCGGEDCFPIYTYGDALNHDFTDRTITLTTFSTSNPSLVYLDGFENSVCDVLVNNKTVERYSTLCNTKDQPTGTYEIKLTWGLENDPEQSYTVKTVQFTVTPGSPLPPPQVADNGNSIITAYQNGQISEQRFETELKALGWNYEQIRQALAVIGKLPHQMNAPVLSEMQQIPQGVDKAAEQLTPQSTKQNMSMTDQYHTQPVQNLDVKTNTSTSQSNSSWNTIVILSSIGGAVAIAGGIFTLKHTRKITN